MLKIRFTRRLGVFVSLCALMKKCTRTLDTTVLHQNGDVLWLRSGFGRKDQIP